MSKINGIDWFPFNDSHFATCAHDCCVKVCCYVAVSQVCNVGIISVDSCISETVQGDG